MRSLYKDWVEDMVFQFLKVGEVSLSYALDHEDASRACVSYFILYFVCVVSNEQGREEIAWITFYPLG